MSDYQLSRRAARMEERWQASRGQKGIISLPAHDVASRQDGTNFRSNMVTLAQYDDAMAGSRGIGQSATWACVNLLSGTVGSLPLMVYRTVGDRKEVAKAHPLYWLLHDSPNGDDTACDFLGFLQASIELDGHGYAHKRISPSGRLTSLVPIPPTLVQRKRKNGGVEYSWTLDGVRTVAGQDQVLHIRGPMGGASTLSACRGVFSSATSVEAAAQAMFRNGVRPSGVLSVDKVLTPEQRTALESILQEKFMGAMNDGRPMVLDNGVKWGQLTIDPQDAQMLETRRFSVEEICRVYGVPPHMIGHTEKTTSWGTGIEQQTLAFQKFTLRPRLKRFEMALEKQLLTPSDRARGISIEFNLEGLLRADSAARASFYREMTQIGAMTINEVRGLENLPPVTGGDVPRMQSQNIPITQAASVGSADKPAPEDNND